MPDFVLKMTKADMDSLCAIRCVDGILAASDENFIWLRGSYELIGQNNKLQQLPVQHTFWVDEKNRLFKKDGLTPVDIISEMNWQPLTSFIKIEMPPSAMPGKTNSRMNIKIIPSVSVKQGEALLLSLKIWKDYADTASAARLHRLQFAVSEKNEVVVMGNPLPPLPGKEYWMNNNILLPSGYDFEIPLLAIFIEEQMNKDKKMFILFDTNSTYQKIEKNFFVPAKRSAVRLTGPDNKSAEND